MHIPVSTLAVNHNKFENVGILDIGKNPMFVRYTKNNCSWEQFVVIFVLFMEFVNNNNNNSILLKTPPILVLNETYSSM